MIKTYFYKDSEQKMYHDIDLNQLEYYLKSPKDLLWIDLYEVTSNELNYIGERFQFHPLAIEDCLHDSPRAKVDKYDDYYFFVFHALKYNEESDNEISTLELNVFLGDNYIVTIHKSPLKSVGRVASRSLRQIDYMDKGPDYLLYNIIDGVTDEYFPIIDRIGVRIDELEDEMYDHEVEEITEEFMALKRSIILIRRVIQPQRRIFSNINGRWSFKIQEENIPYYIDLIDHLERIVDNTETYRDLVNSAMDTYYSIVGAKTNEIVRVLTIISTIMMPLTFITGVFGMNVAIPFEESPFAILVIVFGMTTMAAMMLYAFKKRKWL